MDSTSTNGAGRVLAIVNQKGGVGKSTTAVNLSANLAADGRRILLVDLDPQANATSGLGMNNDARERNVYQALLGSTPTVELIQRTLWPNLDVLCSSIDLAGAEIELVSALSRETKLKKALAPLKGSYDMIIIDCPPSLGLLTLNALVAADQFIVPVQCEYYALEGLGKLMSTIDLVRNDLNPELRIAGAVMTMYDGRTNLSRQVVNEVAKYFGDKMFRTLVPRSIRLSEAPSYGQPITVYDPSSKGAIAYKELALEVCSNG